MDGLVQVDSIRDIDTQNILGSGAIHDCKWAPSAPSLLPLHTGLYVHQQPVKSSICMHVQDMNITKRGYRLLPSLTLDCLHRFELGVMAASAKSTQGGASAAYQVLGHEINGGLSEAAHEDLVGQPLCAAKLVRDNAVYDHNLCSSPLDAVHL